jgi:hypothetical protein
MRFQMRMAFYKYPEVSNSPTRFDEAPLGFFSYLHLDTHRHPSKRLESRGCSHPANTVFRLPDRSRMSIPEFRGSEASV